MMNIERRLKIETEAAAALKANLKDVLEDDVELLQSTIEGETNLNETLEAALDRISEITTFVEAIDKRIATLKIRAERYEAQLERMKTAIHVALQMSEMQKFECAVATVSTRSVPAKVIISEEADIPSDYWKARDPVLDKTAIAAALKDGKSIPGATLSNSSQTISVRFK